MPSKNTVDPKQLASLPALPAVLQISPRVTRVLGQNPGPYTLQGTNTYLVAGDKNSLLIDTGEGKTAYLEHLGPVLTTNPPVSDIILTHWHHDHVGGLPTVLDLINSLESRSLPDRVIPRIWKFKLPSEHGILADHDDQIVDQLQDPADEAKAGGATNEMLEIPNISWLEDGQEFELAADAKLQVIRTPGHTEDSISCLFFDKAARGDQQSSAIKVKLTMPSAVFVGDTVLGGSTSVFEDLEAYLDSLNKLLSITHPPEESTPQPPKLYPGHGEIINDGWLIIQEYISHRLEREDQILALFSDKRLVDSEGCLTTEKIALAIYTSDLPAAVYPSAINGIMQHLIKLQNECRVREVKPQVWCLAST